MLRWLRALGALGGLVAMPLAGCVTATAFEPAAAFFPSGVSVEVDDAYADGRRLYVAMRITSGVDGPIYVDPDGMGLRLPDGRVLRRAAIAGEGPVARVLHREEEAYREIRRGSTRSLLLAFELPPGCPAPSPATLIVGGVSFGTDPTPIVVGEIPLAAPRTVPPPGPPILTPGP